METMEKELKELTAQLSTLDTELEAKNKEYYKNEITNLTIQNLVLGNLYLDRKRR